MLVNVGEKVWVNVGRCAWSRSGFECEWERGSGSVCGCKGKVGVAGPSVG